MSTRSFNRPHRLTAAALAVAGLGLGLLVSTPAFAAAPPVPDGLGVSQPNMSTTILGWTLVEGATKYEVQVDNDPGFTSPELSSTTTNRRIVPTTALPPSQVYWHVRAVNDQNEKSDWSVDQFTVAGVAKPAPQSPADGSVLPQPSSPPLLSWSGTQGATSYTVEVDGDSDFIGAASYTTNTTSLVVPDPLGAGDYWWQVTATKGPGIVSEPSDVFSFLIAALPAPVLVSPSNSTNETVEDVVLDWAPVPGADTYDVQVALDQGFNNLALDVKSVQATRYSPPVTLNNDQFWWRVRAVDLAGQPTPWTASLFGFKRQWLDAPQAVYPLGTEGVPGTMGTEPFFQWTPVKHASSYELNVSTNVNFSPAATKTCKTAATTYTPRSTATSECQYATGTLFYWRVRPIDGPYPVAEGLPGLYSTPQKVSYTRPPRLGADVDWDNQALVNGLKIALDGNGAVGAGGCTPSGLNDICDGVPSTPVLSWDPVPGANFYYVYYAQDEEFTTTEIPSVPATTNTVFQLRLSDSLAQLPESQVGSAYYWHVRPCLTSADCGPDPRSHATLSDTRAFRKASPAIAGVSSTDPSATEITFTWQDYHDTNRAAAYGGELGNQTAKTYRLQVDNDPSFSSPIDTRIVDQATVTAYDDLYPEGTYFWRVQARDYENHGLTWSPVQTFTKSTPAVQLVSPNDGSTVTGTTPFTWNSQAFASSYTLEVYKNNDAAFSPANKLFSATVKTPAYAWNQPVPADATPYIWRVRKTDADGNPGPWSAPFHFTSLGSAPVLTAPASNELVPPNAALLQWSEVAGATKYDLELRATGAASNWASVTTTATAWAPLQTVPGGSWLWRVTAKDSGNNPMGTSAWLGFRVAGTPNANPATLIKGSGAVDSTLTSVAPKWDYDGVTNSYQWLRNGSPIAGATTASYVVTTTDITKSLTLKVTGKLVGYNDGVSVSNEITGVSAPSLTTSSPPTISGTGLVGSTLLATPPTWTEASVSATYQWLRDGSAIAGQAGLAYPVTATDLGSVLSLRVTGSKSGWSDTIVTSNGIQATAGPAPVATVAPGITGTPAVGSTVSATSGSWSQPATFGYQWRRNGAAIAGATGASYTLAPLDAAQQITVLVTANTPGHQPGSAASAPVTVAKASSTTGAVLAKKTVPAGKAAKLVVTVKASGIAGPAGKVKIRDGAKVVKTVTLTAAMKGKITVKLTKLKSGKHKLSAQYVGDAATKASKSAVAKLTIGP